MKKYIIEAPVVPIHGEISLEGSKSISNRLLIMRALCHEFFDISNLSPSDDTNTLARLLNSNGSELNVGAAGTTMRFLTSFLAIGQSEKILTGSERMKKRPIGILVDALRTLGAEIDYIGENGFPPLHIKGKKISGGKVSIQSDVSSQYISSLMMIGPALENGLELELTGKISSFPYINMTLATMQELGIDCGFNGNIISIRPGKYISKPMTAESDWSAASYHYSICSLSPGSEIVIHGLFQNSLQGDSILPELYAHFGVTTTFTGQKTILSQNGNISDYFAFDFSDCPDIAQTTAVTAACLGVAVDFTGVESLKIKETDRTAALQAELKKFDVVFDQHGDVWKLRGKASLRKNISIATYEDHRMAMCFAPMCLKTGNILIEEPDVVNKSYPSFWSDLSSLGFCVSAG